MFNSAEHCFVNIIFPPREYALKLVRFLKATICLSLCHVLLEQNGGKTWRKWIGYIFFILNGLLSGVQTLIGVSRLLTNWRWLLVGFDYAVLEQSLANYLLLAPAVMFRTLPMQPSLMAPSEFIAWSLYSAPFPQYKLSLRRGQSTLRDTRLERNTVTDRIYFQSKPYNYRRGPLQRRRGPFGSALSHFCLNWNKTSLWVPAKSAVILSPKLGLMQNQLLQIWFGRSQVNMIISQCLTLLKVYE